MLTHTGSPELLATTTTTKKAHRRMRLVLNISKQIRAGPGDG